MLTDLNVANTACPPSRAAMLTGTYAYRIGMEGGAGNLVVAFPGDKRGINPDEIILAEMLRENGYATCCFGKWHLRGPTAIHAACPVIQNLFSVFLTQPTCGLQPSEAIHSPTGGCTNRSQS